MPEERICHICGRANPIDQPRCINCGQRASGTILVAESKEGSSSAVTPWWTSSTTGSIPPPPQVVEEVNRAERTRLDEERRRLESEKRLAEVREFEARCKAQETPQEKRSTLVVDSCPRCGSTLESPSNGTAFSFCLRCGADVPHVSRTTRSTYEGTTTASGTQTVRGVAVATAAQSTRSQTNPIVPTVLSFLVPGVGQIMNGQVVKGILLLLACYVAINVISIPAFSILALVGRIVASVDANRIAERRRSGAVVRDGEWDLG